MTKIPSKLQETEMKNENLGWNGMQDANENFHWGYILNVGRSTMSDKECICFHFLCLKCDILSQLRYRIYNIKNKGILLKINSSTDESDWASTIKNRGK